MSEVRDKDILDPEELAAVPRAFIVVQRRTIRRHLTVFRRDLRLSREYDFCWSCPVAIGDLNHPTPKGPFFVLAKARHPDWTMPHSDWVPKELQGVTVPGGDPNNPIKEAFLKLTDDGIGIHGTDNLASLGQRASHGCIRVRPHDAINLYHIVPTGTPVYIR